VQFHPRIQLLDHLGHFFLHAWNEVTINIKRDGRPGVSQTSRDDNHWYPMIEHQRYSGVAQIMGTDFRQTGCFEQILEIPHQDAENVLSAKAGGMSSAHSSRSISIKQRLIAKPQRIGRPYANEVVGRAFVRGGKGIS
jgi:hypothetical protein